MPILLELFSGTGSIGKAFKARGWEVFSVDIDPAAKPTLVADVLSLELEKDLPPHVDAIWASPPCTHYSSARTKARTPRDLEGSDALVRKVLDIFKHYGEPDWFMENPHSGLMKTREVVQGLPMRVVDYCKYGKSYRKRTSIWTTLDGIRRGLCAATTALLALGRGIWQMHNKEAETADHASLCTSSTVFQLTCVKK